MKTLAESLHRQLSQRITIWPLIISAVEAFTGDMSWVELENRERMEAIARTKLTEIFANLVGVRKETFLFEDCFPAYLVFVSFSRQKFVSGVKALERIWELFCWTKYHEDDLYSNFIDLFEFIQIKGYSEAICETVGSIMCIHHGRGRNLHPVNLNKELFLRFNLPPMHILKKSIIPAIVREKLECEHKEFMSQHSRKDQLKFGYLSATIGNFRQSEEKNSHIPLSMFKEM